MLKFDKEITKVKMLKCMIMNYSCEFLTIQYYILCLFKNNISTLIKISLLTLGGVVIKRYLLKKLFFLHTI